MNSDKYESLPTTNILINMTAGGIAGLTEHLIVYPLDVVKTRMQSFSQPTIRKNSISSILTEIIKKEGVGTSLRGLTVLLLGSVPAHALYFSSYELTKELLTGFTTHNNFNYTISSIVATLIHDGIATPAEVIKQRMQMYNTKCKSLMDCVHSVYYREGITAFYRSFTTQFLMNIPFQSVHFIIYEFLQNKLNHERKYNPKVHIIAGGIAGSIAAAITTPLDVVKTLLNTQEIGFTKNLRQAVIQIHAKSKFSGFFKGINARVLHAAPSTAICWSTFEFFRYILSNESSENYKSSITGQNQLKSKNGEI